MKADSIDELADKLDNWIKVSQGKMIKKKELVRRIFPKIEKARSEGIGFSDITKFLKTEGVDIKESSLRFYYHELKVNMIKNSNKLVDKSNIVNNNPNIIANNNKKFRIIDDDL